MPMTIAFEDIAIDASVSEAIFASARTANAFNGEVSEAQAQANYDLAKFGPTAFNLQPLRVTYVRSDEARATLVDSLSNGRQQGQGRRSSAGRNPQARHRMARAVGRLPSCLQRPKAKYDADADVAFAAAAGNNNAHL